MGTMKTHMAALTLALAAAGCVDNNYDLTDIDTTIRVSVDRLVIPVNIDAITLGDIFNLKDGGDVQIIDGVYAITKEGNFTSDEIIIPSIHMQAPTVNSTEATITLGGIPSRAGGEFTYNLRTEGSEYTFTSSRVSEFITDIDYVECDVALSLTYSLKGLEDVISGMTLKNVVVQMPKGLTLTEDAGGNYNPATGELAIGERRITGTSLVLNLRASGLDFKQAGGVYNYAAAKASLPGSLYLKEGEAVVSMSDIKPGVAQLPSSVVLRADYELSDIDIYTFSGKVRYSIGQNELAQVDLTHLPDVLSQESTNLTFVNPMLYLHVTNPMQGYDMYARTGLEIEAYHKESSTTYDLDEPYFQIGPSEADGEYNFCLSPQTPLVPDAAFADATHVPFAELSKVLSGNGVPQTLKVRLTNPMIPEQPVRNMRLGSDLGALHGNYRLLAPLQFAAGSTITYISRMDGWGNDDLDLLTVTALEVTLCITTDVPVHITLTGYPIDRSGQQIGDVEITGADIDADADEQRVTLRATGAFSGLDGIEFKAVAVATDSHAPLNPDMKVRLSEIRPCVTGYYDKEL